MGGAAEGRPKKLRERAEWELAQLDAQRLSSVGLAALIGISEEPPEITDAGAEALEVWAFMGGWQPQALATACELYAVRDPERLVELLGVIRRVAAERRQLQEE
jgi:hypothetical protein